MQICMKRAMAILGSNLDITPIPIEFEKALKFEIVVKSRGWTVDTDRPATVRTIWKVCFP